MYNTGNGWVGTVRIAESIPTDLHQYWDGVNGFEATSRYFQGLPCICLLAKDGQNLSISVNHRTTKFTALILEDGNE
jgi:hypothetical protein